MTLPQTRVEFAWGSGFSTPEESRTWYDATPYYVEKIGVSITGYGRADDRGQPTATSCSLTLDNTDGRFTPGLATGANYPNVKKGVPIRVSVRYADQGSGNLLSAENSSFEGGTLGDWVATGSGGVGAFPTLVNSTTHPAFGTKCMRITWPTRAADGAFPALALPGLVVGRTYTVSTYVWVAAGTPAVRLQAAGGFGASSSITGALQRISITFVATAPTEFVVLSAAAATTAGQQIWADAFMLDEGSTVGTFTTSPPPTSIRFTGYVGGWPLSWPNGGDSYSVVAISATSRRVRLGQTAKLPSAIRAANLAVFPQAYWPMDETGLQDAAGQYIFWDVTDPTDGRKSTQFMAGFAPDDGGTYIYLNDGTPGPTDEPSLVKFIRTSNPATAGNLNRYIGGADTIRIGTGAGGGDREFSVSCVARVAPGIPSATNSVDVTLMQVWSSDMLATAWFFLFDNTRSGGSKWVGCDLRIIAQNGTILDDPAWFPAPGVDSAEIYDRAVDGEIHHYYLMLFSDVNARLYFDGEWVAWCSLDSGFTFTQPFTGIAIGERTLFADAWIGHAAVDDFYYGDSSIATLADAATAATETVEERVDRLATFLGVPLDEVDVEDTIAAPLGPQPEKDRTATDVLDEAASSTGGVLYDARGGHLTLQARNHRYNAATAFTLSTSADEIEPDLEPVTDDRYLLNDVRVTRVGSQDTPPVEFKDQDSIDDYGVYDQDIQMVSASDDEAEALGYDQIYRFSQPQERVSQVSIVLSDLSPSQRALVLAADIGTKFALAGLPRQASASTLALFLEGVGTETISLAGHSMTANTTPATYPAMAVVGSAVVGDSTLVVY